MKKILQITTSVNWGAIGRLSESIGKECIENGWESYIAWGRYCNESESKTIRIGSFLSICIHYYIQRLFDNEGLCSWISTWLFVKKIKKIKPDVIILHNIHDHILNYKILFHYLNKSQIPVLWVFHDFWAITGHCMHFISKRCEKYKNGCDNCPMKGVFPKTCLDRSKQNYILKKKIFSSCTRLTIVPVSEWVGLRVQESFLKDKKMVVIPNGIDTEVFKPTSYINYSNFSFLKEHENQFIILGVASQWKNGKGFDDFLRISHFLNNDELIILVGVDDDLRLTLPSNIIGISHINSSAELAALYTRANVVVSLSEAETFGLTIIEGFACGTPAVVYDNTAPPLLISSQTGYVAKNHDVHDVYNCISEIKLKGKDYYSKSCIDLVHLLYNKSVCSKNYMRLIESSVQSF